MNDSMRAGGIHWAATMDADEFVEGARRVRESASQMSASLKQSLRFDSGGFVKGALQQKSELLQLQQQLKSIATNDKLDNLEKAQLSAPFRERRDEMVANMKAADNERRERITQAMQGLARYESFVSQAIPAANKKAATSFKEINNSLKSVFGRGSDFKEFLEIVSGAGAVAGIGILTNALAGMGAAMKSASEDMATGAKTAGEAFNGFLRSIPILGSGGAAIADSISALSFGGNASLAENNVFIKRAGAANARFGQMVEERRARERSGTPSGAIREDFRKRMAELRDLSNSGGVGPGQFANESAALKAEMEAALRKLQPPGNGNGIWADVTKSIYKSVVGSIEGSKNSASGNLYGISLKVKSWWEDVKQNATDALAQAIEDETNDLEAEDEINAAIKRMRDEEADAAQRQRETLLSSARSIYERLKSEQGLPIAFASGQLRGSQEDVATRMQRMLGNLGGGKSEKQLMAEAVKLAQEEVNQSEDLNDKIGALIDRLGLVKDFN